MTTIVIRNNTAAGATSSNPTLAEGEPGFETDTGRLKIGDGSTAWNSLAYIEENMDLGYWTRRAESQVLSDYSDTVSVSEKNKSLLKFGRNESLGTSQAMVWAYGPDQAKEVLPTTNAITHFSSSDSGDAQEIVIEGHTISGTTLTFVTQTVTLAGQTKTSLTTPIARATRLYNNGSTDFAGTVYVYEDDTVSSGEPNTSSKVHLSAADVFNQSQKAATALSNSDYYFLTQFYGNVLKKQSASVDFQLQVRLPGKVFRTILNRGAGTDGSDFDMQLRPFLIIPKNSDIRIVATSDTAGTDVQAGFNGLLAEVQ